MAASSLTHGRTDGTGTRAVEAGLDALDDAAQLPKGPGLGKRLVRGLLPPLVFLAALVGVWQLAYEAKIKPSYALPAPAEVGEVFWSAVTDGRAAEAIWTSLSRGGLGFALSLVVGTLLGLAMWWSRWLRAAIGPIVSGLQSLPSVAWVPAAIIWFGLTDAAIYTVVLLGAVPSIANGLLSGMKQVPPLFDRVGRVLGLSALGRTRYVLLPAALPGYLGGLRQGWAFAWRSLMAAEIYVTILTGFGLGHLLHYGRELNAMEQVIGIMIVIVVIGLVVDRALFSPWENFLHRRWGTNVRQT